MQFQMVDSGGNVVAQSAALPVQAEVRAHLAKLSRPACMPAYPLCVHGLFRHGSSLPFLVICSPSMCSFPHQPCSAWFEPTSQAGSRAAELGR